MSFMVDNYFFLSTARDTVIGDTRVVCNPLGYPDAIRLDG